MEKASPFANCALLQCEELVCMVLFGSLRPPDGHDVGRGMLSPGFSRRALSWLFYFCSSLHCFFPKGPFAVTAYSWALPVEEELLRALTQLQAQHNCGSTLCSSLGFSSAFHFPYTPVKSVCKATKPPPCNHQPSSGSDLICLSAAAGKQRSLTCMNLRTVMVLYPGRERKSPT